MHDPIRFRPERLQAMMIAAGIITIVMGGVLRYDPALLDPWWARLGIAVVPWMIAVASRLQAPRWVIEVSLRLLAYLALVWSAWLLALNDFPPGFSSAILLLQTFAMIVFPTTIESAAYSLAVVVTVLSAGALSSVGLEIPVGLAGTAAGMGVLTSLSAHHRMSLSNALIASHDTLEDKVAQRTTELQQEIAVRREAEARAIEASNAKSRFLANMSHELRTPLNAILGYIEMVDEELETSEPAQLREDLAIATRASHRLLDLVNDVLDLARIEADTLHLVPEAIDLHDLVTSTLAELQPSAQSRGVLLAVEGEAPVVTTDATRARQILVNLLSNAIKFTEDGSVTVRLAHKTGTVRIAVQDTGCGIESSQLPRLFQRFTQVDESSTRTAEGTGIGLALSRDLAQRLGGDLVASSEPGVGSTFTLVLPLKLLPPTPPKDIV